MKKHIILFQIEMVLYVGYPVTYETACGLLKIPINDTSEDSLLVAVKNVGLQLHSTDKGQNILGLEVDGVSDLWTTFVSVDEAMIRILQTKKKLKDLINKANIDLSDFMLEKMEGEPERVYNPEPYLISC
jgi:hypothetical protein